MVTAFNDYTKEKQFRGNFFIQLNFIIFLKNFMLKFEQPNRFNSFLKKILRTFQELEPIDSLNLF